MPSEDLRWYLKSLSLSSRRKKLEGEVRSLSRCHGRNRHVVCALITRDFEFQQRQAEMPYLYIKKKWESE